MTENVLFALSLKRPKDFFNLSPETQWAIDKSLGILDWLGGCGHTDNHTLCAECKEIWTKHYGLKTEK